MPARIVVFGATGYTGQLTAEALVAHGQRPVLAGRSADRLAVLASRLGGLETAVADVERPESVMAIVGAGDVLISTVGPFLRRGDPAVRAAMAAPATYLDSNGEPIFIRRVFERFGPEAARAGAALLTAFGYDYVPGNLAAALALRDAGDRAVRVDVGYYVTGDPRGGLSGGTRASMPDALLEPHFCWRGGLRVERAAKRLRSFTIEGRQRQAVSWGGSEHLCLPRIDPGLRQVDVYLGWFGPASRAVQALFAATAAVGRLPGARARLQAIGNRLLKGSSGGPDADTRARLGSHVVAIALDAHGAELSEVHLAGANAYDLTARILAWGAERAAHGAVAERGALGPVDGFGLDELEAGCKQAGLTRL